MGVEALESDVSHLVAAADRPDLLSRAKPFERWPNYLEGIGFLYDRGSYMEVRYDGCHHATNFMRNGVTFAEAAKWVRQEMATCGVCDFQARVERFLGHG